MSRLILLASLFALNGTFGCTDDGEHNLIYASGTGDNQAVVKLIEMVDSPDFRSFDGDTPLTLAAKRGHLAVVQTLISAGANVQYTDASGLSPMFWAAYMGRTEVVSYLISIEAKFAASDLTVERLSRIEADFPHIAKLLREAGSLTKP